MKKRESHVLIVASKQPPTVEIDAAASAIYVRFKRGRVARTIRHDSKWPLVTVDVDAAGGVLGVECVGVNRFVLQDLLRRAAIQAPAEAVAHAKFHLAAIPLPVAA
jgi:uncharacterized protein YuzE